MTRDDRTRFRAQRTPGAARPAHRAAHGATLLAVAALGACATTAPASSDGALPRVAEHMAVTAPPDRHAGAIPLHGAQAPSLPRDPEASPRPGLLEASSERFARQDEDDDLDDEDWDYALMPYYWAASIDGSTTIDGMRVTTDGDAFSDPFDQVEFSGGLAFEAREDDRTILLDATYIELDADSELGPADIDLEGDLWIVQGSVGGELAEEGAFEGLEGYVGLRYWNFDPDIEVSGAPDLTGGENWFDPLVGLRRVWVLDDEGEWDVVLLGDVGGGGFGDWASEFAYQAAALLRRRYESGSLVIGYRVLESEYEEGSGSDEFRYDNTLYGPLLGWQFRF